MHFSSTEGQGVEQGPTSCGAMHEKMGRYEGIRQGEALRQPAGHGALLPCSWSLGT